MMVNAFAEYGWIILNAGTGGGEGGEGWGAMQMLNFPGIFFFFFLLEETGLNAMSSQCVCGCG